MITIEKEIEKYISDVNSKLLCSKEKKKELIEDIRGAVFDFAEESSTKNIADIYKHFGTPEELAKAHMSELDPEKIKRKVNIRKVVIISIVMSMIIFVIALIFAIVDSHNSGSGYTIITPAEELLVSIKNTSYKGEIQ